MIEDQKVPAKAHRVQSYASTCFAAQYAAAAKVHTAVIQATTAAVVAIVSSIDWAKQLELTEYMEDGAAYYVRAGEGGRDVGQWLQDLGNIGKFRKHIVAESSVGRALVTDVGQGLTETYCNRKRKPTPCRELLWHTIPTRRMRQCHSRAYRSPRRLVLQ